MEVDDSAEARKAKRDAIYAAYSAEVANVASTTAESVKLGRLFWYRYRKETGKSVAAIKKLRTAVNMWVLRHRPGFQRSPSEQLGQSMIEMGCNLEAEDTTHHCEFYNTSTIMEDRVDGPTKSDIRDRSMRVIMPGNSSWSEKVIQTIKVLDTFLSLASTREVLDEILTPNRKGDKRKRSKKKKQTFDNLHVRDHPPIQRPEILDNKDARHGIRFIQAGRYEIFVQACGTKSYVFDWICEQVWSILCQQKLQLGDSEELDLYKSSNQIKQEIVKYAVQQAERDDRISSNIKSKRNVKYDNFSLIVNYDPVTAQPKHIDLIYPNFQYGLIITDKSPGTTVYIAPKSIRNVADVNNHVWNDMPLTLSKVMEQDATVASLLSQFGDVLCPNIKPVKYFESSNDTVKAGEDFTGSLGETPRKSIADGSITNDVLYSTESSTNSSTSSDVLFVTGTLLALPGSEIHAGPSTSKYRTVLFFSACPDVTNTIPYRPDTQYFAPLLCSEFICLLWNKLCTTDRVYLLYRLLESIKETKCQHLERNLTDKNMIQFLEMVTNWEEKKRRARNRVTKHSKYDSLDEYIQDFASSGQSIDSERMGCC